MSSKKKSTQPAPAEDFDSLVTSIVHLHQQTQDFATKAVNVALTLRNWLIGCRIVEFEQQGKDRAAYGERLLLALAQRLTAAGLKRVDVRELRRFRLLYEVYPQIRETLTPELLTGLGIGATLPPLKPLPESKRETLSPESQIVESLSPKLVHRLSFSHFAELIDIPDATQRRFYEIECIRGNWSVRELRRQIASLYYERSGLSKDKSKLSAMAHAAAESMQPTHIIRDPYEDALHGPEAHKGLLQNLTAIIAPLQALHQQAAEAQASKQSTDMNRNGSFWRSYGCLQKLMANHHNFGAATINCRPHSLFLGSISQDAQGTPPPGFHQSRQSRHRPLRHLWLLMAIPHRPLMGHLRH
jgi:hypothetical protein